MAKILIVDDEKMICEEFKEILTDDGHEVETAMNGVDGLKLFEQHPFDIVFLDVLMPRMEGREVFDAMKRIRTGVPVVIMSGYLPPNKENDILAMGAVACLRKPLDLNRVKEIIQSVSNI